MAKKEEGECCLSFSKDWPLPLLYVQCCCPIIHACLCVVVYAIYLLTDNACKGVIDVVVFFDIADDKGGLEGPTPPDPTPALDIRDTKRAGVPLIECASDRGQDTSGKLTELDRRDPSSKCGCGRFWRQELLQHTDLLLRFKSDVAALIELTKLKIETGVLFTTRPMHPGSVVEIRPCSKKVGEVRKEGFGQLLLPILDSLICYTSLHPCFRRFRAVAMESCDAILAVSYTHLTLPTKRIV